MDNSCYACQKFMAGVCEGTKEIEYSTISVIVECDDDDGECKNIRLVCLPEDRLFI